MSTKQNDEFYEAMDEAGKESKIIYDIIEDEYLDKPSKKRRLWDMNVVLFATMGIVIGATALADALFPQFPILKPLFLLSGGVVMGLAVAKALDL